MVPLCWSILFLCLSANAENIALCRESGENVTLECSSAACPSTFEGYDGMYLYREFKEKEEVLFCSSNPGNPDKITPRERYKNRIQTNGSLKKRTVTISNLTVDDSGLYTCVYQNLSIEGVQCNVYPLVVRGVASCCRSDDAPFAPANKETLPVNLIIIIATCANSTLLTIIVILLIVPRMKQWTSSRRRTTRVLQFSDDVYEAMGKNILHPPAAPEQSPPSQV